MTNLNRTPLHAFLLTSCLLLATTSHANSGNDTTQLITNDLTVSVMADSFENVISLPTTQSTDTSLLEIVSQPTNGVLTFSDMGSAVQYTPDSGFIGSDTYSYRVSDEIASGETTTVSVNVVANNPENAISNYVANGITVNGDLSDWSSLNLFAEDPIDVSFSSNDRIDLRQAGIAHNADTAYIVYDNQYDVNANSSTGTELVWGWQTYLDTDNNTSTGFQLNDGIGADYLAEGKALYQYTGNGETWSWVKVTDTNPQFQNNVVELSFPRKFLGSHSTVKVAFVGNNRAYGGTSVDFYPENGALAYYFGESFFEAETVVVDESAETSSSAHIPPVTTTSEVAISSSTSTSTSSSGGGGSTSWWLFMLPALLLFRRR